MALLCGGDINFNMTKSQLKKALYTCSVAFMMNYAAYGGLLFLQTSINIEGGLGNTGLFTIFATSAFSTIFFIPFLIDFKGAKAAIVAGEIGAMTYTIANFYPRWFTIIPAAICHGVVESAPWAGSSVYVTTLGERYSKACCGQQVEKATMKRGLKESCVYRFFCIFYVFVYCSQVLGNGLVSIVFRSMTDRSQQGDFLGTAYSNISGNISNTLSIPTESDDAWKMCGANECQADFIYNSTAEDLENYHPDNMAVYLLLSIFLTMQISFTAMFAFCLPDVRPQPAHQSSCNNNPPPDVIPVDEATLKTKLKILSSAVKIELKQTFRHVMSPLHLLIFPFVFYSGVFIAFSVGEFTRAYVSCTLGVEFVGFAAVVYGSSSMVTSAISTKLIPLLGRNVFIGLMFLAHSLVFFLCCFWAPTVATTWLIFVCAACLGICDGMMTNTTQGMFATYFEGRLAIAFSIKNFATNLGIVAGTGWSTYLCVDQKIYILFALLVFSAITYIGADRTHRRNLSIRTTVEIEPLHDLEFRTASSA